MTQWMIRQCHPGICRVSHRTSNSNSILDGESSRRILTINNSANVTITNLKFQNGNGNETEGSAIHLAAGSEATIKNNDFQTENISPSIFFADQTPTVHTFCGNDFDPENNFSCTAGGTCPTHDASCD